MTARITNIDVNRIKKRDDVVTLDCRSTALTVASSAEIEMELLGANAPGGDKYYTVETLPQEVEANTKAKGAAAAERER